MEPTRPEESISKLGPVVQIDEGKIQAHLDEVVRNTVEETLNALLELEADRLCGARRYERSEGRLGLATYFGPLAEVNSGPAAEAYWTGLGVGDAMYPGLKRSESLGYIECDRSACFLTPAFLHRAPEAVAVRTGLDDVRPIRDAIQQRLA